MPVVQTNSRRNLRRTFRGGFRATLYHLGLLRFLRDANLLQNVSHITAVSGGSVMAAHLGLNWKRYTGSESDFDEAATELLDFIRLDVRNRILRRWGLGFFLRALRRLVGLSNPRLSRTGLLDSVSDAPSAIQAYSVPENRVSTRHQRR
jgi:hypothetical protein